MSEQYPSDWDSRRKQVYRRDDHTCQNCGALGGPSGNAELHAHHIVPKSSGGTHKLSNLKTVCARCHRAIHGNSIAPSADDGLVLDEERYPYSVHEHVRCVNLVAEITDTKYNEVLDSFDELLGHVDTVASPSELDTDYGLERRWETLVEDIESDLEDLESDFNRLIETPIDLFSSECVGAYESTTEAIDEDIGHFRNLLDVLKELHGKAEVSRSDFTEIVVAKEELENSQETTSEVVEEFAARVDSDIVETVERVDERSTTGGNEFEKCPVCGSTDDILMSEPGLVQCRECKAELIRKGSNWKLMNGPSEWVGEELLYWYWKKLGEVDFRTKKEKSDIRRRSNTHAKRFLRIKVAAIGLSLVGITSSLVIFDIIPAVVTIVLGLSAIAYYEFVAMSDPDL